MPAEEIVKGWEVSKGEFLVVEGAELEAIARVGDSRSIEISRFVPVASVDPVYFDRSYLLVPAAQRAAGRAYVLLLRAMTGTGMAGIGQFLQAGREKLALIRPKGDALALETLFLAEDVYSQAEIDQLVGETEVKEAELDLARQLVDSLVGEFEPTEMLVSGYRRDLRSLLEAKLAGEEIARPELVSDRPVVDLLGGAQAQRRRHPAPQGSRPPDRPEPAGDQARPSPPPIGGRLACARGGAPTDGRVRPFALETVRQGGRLRRDGPGECRQLEPGRYQVRFLLGSDAAAYSGLGRLLEWVRHWRASRVYEGEELVSVFHVKEMAWCASFYLSTFGECRERFLYGVLPRCGVCPLFDSERAIRAGIPEELAPALAIGDGTDALDSDSGGHAIVLAPDLFELLSSEPPDWLDLSRLYPDTPPKEWEEPEPDARPH